MNLASSWHSRREISLVTLARARVEPQRHLLSQSTRSGAPTGSHSPPADRTGANIIISRSPEVVLIQGLWKMFMYVTERAPFLFLLSILPAVTVDLGALSLSDGSTGGSTASSNWRAAIRCGSYFDTSGTLSHSLRNKVRAYLSQQRDTILYGRGSKEQDGSSMLFRWIYPDVQADDPEAMWTDSDSDLDEGQLDELNVVVPVRQCKEVKEETKNAPGKHLAWPDSFYEW